MKRITKGLDLPISGEPNQKIDEQTVPVNTVALMGADYIGMKPTMQVAEGDRVKLGQVLFADKKREGVVYTSPGAGIVKAINRGAKRAFQSVEIALEGDDQVTFQNYGDQDLTRLTRQQVIENLVASGLWTSLRTRPFSKIPAIDAVPRSLFINAMDTNPLAVDPSIVILRRERDFNFGLQVLRHLTDGPVFLCRRPNTHLEASRFDFVRDEQFDGPHPAGLVGTHIHFLDPVGPGKSVWHIGYQDVIAIGHLFVTGRLDPERIVSIGGPMVSSPAIVRTRLGASVSDLIEGRLSTTRDRVRVISGSVLTGRAASGPYDYLERYSVQVSCIGEGQERELLGWQKPGFDKFSVTRAFASAFAGAGRKFAMTSTTNGSRRAMVPIGSYEKVVPLDMIPTFLLRSLIVGDTEQAQALGCLELDEEDLALCTFVCPGKYEYGSILRENLDRIEKEG